MNPQQSNNSVDADDGVFNPCGPAISNIELNNSQQIKKWYREPSHRQVDYYIIHSNHTRHIL